MNFLACGMVWLSFDYWDVQRSSIYSSTGMAHVVTCGLYFIFLPEGLGCVLPKTTFTLSNGITTWIMSALYKCLEEPHWFLRTNYDYNPGLEIWVSLAKPCFAIESPWLYLHLWQLVWPWLACATLPTSECRMKDQQVLVRWTVLHRSRCPGKQPYLGP